MTNNREAVMKNFGQENIDAIRESLRHSDESEPRTAFTMSRASAGTKVDITAESRRAFGKAMLR